MDGSNHPPVWLSALAVLALTGGALSMYGMVYRPARERRVRVESEFRNARSRVQRLQARVMRLRTRNESFEQGDPEERGESMREQLRLPEYGEIVIPDLFRHRDGETDA